MVSLLSTDVREHCRRASSAERTGPIFLMFGKIIIETGENCFAQPFYLTVRLGMPGAHHQVSDLFDSNNDGKELWKELWAIISDWMGLYCIQNGPVVNDDGRHISASYISGRNHPC